MAEWTAVMANDPDREFALVVEILEDENWRGRIERLSSGDLVVAVYPDADALRIPAKWLSDLIASADRELPPLETRV